jgi:hypothetical protein
VEVVEPVEIRGVGRDAPTNSKSEANVIDVIGLTERTFTPYASSLIESSIVWEAACCLHDRIMLS